MSIEEKSTGRAPFESGKFFWPAAVALAALVLLASIAFGKFLGNRLLASTQTNGQMQAPVAVPLPTQQDSGTHAPHAVAIPGQEVPLYSPFPKESVAPAPPKTPASEPAPVAAAASTTAPPIKTTVVELPPPSPAVTATPLPKVELPEKPRRSNPAPNPSPAPSATAVPQPSPSPTRTPGFKGLSNVPGF